MERQEILDRLKEIGLRTTPQRIALLQKLSELKGHIKAEDIYNIVKKEIPSISISTVYRTLKEFEEKGIISSLPSSVSYGLTIFDTNSEPHHHFICKICGSIYDIPGKDIEIKTKNIRGVVESTTAVLRGICDSCKSKRKKL